MCALLRIPTMLFTGNRGKGFTKDGQDFEKRKLFAVLWILLIALMPNIGKAEGMDAPAEYSFETILANGNKIENEFVFLAGIPK